MLGVQRLEATTLLENVRANGAMRKLGAVAEGVLRGSFVRKGEAFDQMLYSIREEDYQSMRAPVAALARTGVH